MATFSENIWFEVEHCSACGIAFAMTADFEKRRRNDHKTFYCPAGHALHYNGPSEAQKLKQELERKEQMLAAAQARAATAENERKQITSAHKKMRERVMNGVCPCCNRTFQNLMQHMRSEHPDYSSIRTLKTLRTAFGMTQAQVAKEAGVDYTHVSLYERDKPVAPYIKERLDNWLEKHNAAEEHK
jgi:DNA-binding XRE family transcriptional regulator